MRITLRRHAAVNNRCKLDTGGLGSDAGGGTGERYDEASGVDRGGTVASPSRGVFSPLFTGGSGFFLTCRQGAGEVRDAAGTSGRRPTRFGSCCSTWLFPGCVLSDSDRVRPIGDGGASRRAARSSWPDQAATRRSWTSSAPRTVRGRRSPSRWPTGSGCSCTGAPSSGCVGGERPVVLAAVAGGAGRLRNAARPRPRALRSARRVWPRPGSPGAD